MIYLFLNVCVLDTRKRFWYISSRSASQCVSVSVHVLHRKIFIDIHIEIMLVIGAFCSISYFERLYGFRGHYSYETYLYTAFVDQDLRFYVHERVTRTLFFFSWRFKGLLLLGESFLYWLNWAERCTSVKRWFYTQLDVTFLNVKILVRRVKTIFEQGNWILFTNVGVSRDMLNGQLLLFCKIENTGSCCGVCSFLLRVLLVFVAGFVL
jgi:hypothetical protein